MPVDKKHPEYEAMEAIWQRCRDFCGGQDSVKQRGTYLRAPGGLEYIEQAEYVERAVLYEAVAKTVHSFVGAICRRPHVIELPDKMAPVMADATGKGVSLPEFVKTLCTEVLLQGRGGVLVEWDEDLNRPVLAFYPAEAITSWSSTSVTLFETVYEADHADPFAQMAVDQYRHLALIEGVYTVSVYRKNQSGPSALRSEWVLYEDPREPTARGKKFAAIPFVWLSTMGPTAGVMKPPLLGLVNLAESHFRLMADLLHGAHFTGLPTLYMTGITESDGPLRVGSTAIITARDPAAKVGYAEFSGQGLGALERLVATTESRMAAMGAAILGAEASKRAETATAAELRHGSETALLSAAVAAVEATLRQALAIAAAWQSASGSIVVELNNVFVAKRLDGQTLIGLVQAFQADALSLDALLQALADGEIISQAEADADKMKAPPAPAKAA